MKLFKILKAKALDVVYGQAPRLMKVIGPAYVFTRKILTNMIWIGMVAIPIEAICRQWSMIWCTLAAMAASMAASEAQRMRRAFKAWGFGEHGPNS
jgi:hypothetical protein